MSFLFSFVNILILLSYILLYIVHYCNSQCWNIQSPESPSSGTGSAITVPSKQRRLNVLLASKYHSFILHKMWYSLTDFRFAINMPQRSIMQFTVHSPHQRHRCNQKNINFRSHWRKQQHMIAQDGNLMLITLNCRQRMPVSWSRYRSAVRADTAPPADESWSFAFAATTVV